MRIAILSVTTFAAALCCVAAGPERLTLKQAGSRAGPDFAPAYLGNEVLVSGVVSVRAIRVHYSGYAHLGIQEDGYGLVLEARPETALDHLAPGQRVEVRGQVSARGGLPVVVPSEISVLGSGPPPSPQVVSLDQLRGFELLGLYVVTEGVVQQAGENSGGFYLDVGSPEAPFRIFAPFRYRRDRRESADVRVGDKIRVAGLASQYCPVPPHNQWFQLMIDDPKAVVRLGRSWWLPPWAIASIIGCAFVLAVLLWRREERHRRQREMLRAVYELGEEILSSGSAVEVLKTVVEGLPRVFGVTEVSLYLHNRNAKTLDPVNNGGAVPDPPIPLAATRTGAPAAVASCFRNRTLLAIPNTARSPFAADNEGRSGVPRSLMLIPMFAQGEPEGVLVLAQAARTRTFTAFEKLIAQHLGNQIGVAIKLMEQRSIREQLFRTEKVAAVGRLITGVVNELQGPLSCIACLAEQNLAQSPGAELQPALQEIYFEAVRASSIVNRLISFNRPDQVEVRPTDVNRLLRGLMEFRELEWKARGIQVRSFLREGPLFALGSQGQLEQVCLSLLVFAEQSLTETTEKIISIGSNLLARRILVEISFTAQTSGEADPFAVPPNGAPGTLDLSLCRSVIAGHEGEIRLTRTRAAESRFEIELPWVSVDTEAAKDQPRLVREPGRQLTALLMEPDETTRPQLVKLLEIRGYRVVPVSSSEEGLDLTQRLRFDVAFCSVRLPGLNWIELLQRASPKVGAFVLIADGYESRVTAVAGGQAYFILPKPVEEGRLDYILDHLDQPAMSAASGLN